MDAAKRTWRKIGEAEMRLNQVAPDGCAVAVNRKRHVEVEALCAPPQEREH